MPTILNNACINRVQKVLKLKLTSNDLTALKTTPFKLLRCKNGNICNIITSVIVFVPSGYGYNGSLLVSNSVGTYQFIISYTDDNSPNKVDWNQAEGITDWYYLSVDPNFEIGSARPDIEVHFYYYSESVSVDFDIGFVQEI